jgi:hypothetical protein
MVLILLDLLLKISGLVYCHLSVSDLLVNIDGRLREGSVVAYTRVGCPCVRADGCCLFMRSAEVMICYVNKAIVLLCIMLGIC